ncbi:MAG: hypothetical protein P8Q35_02585 [Candidatus Thalassarchaeaceae archaeon]|nr:hypothetical protein [Candidatus Thalassarchaeaceae archaeon]
MGENGMHSKNAGGRQSRPSAPHHINAKLTVGFSGLRRRAVQSNAVGYSPREAPRPTRPDLSTRGRHHDLANRENE